MQLVGLEWTKLARTVTYIGTFSLCLNIWAIDKSPIPFTEEEISTHKQNIGIITTTAANCLQDRYTEHVKFFKKYGVSKFYGNRNPIYKTPELRRDALTSLGKDPSLEKQMKPIACIDLAMQCLSEGFSAGGQSDVWDRIYAELAIGRNFYGTELQKMLQGLGWKILYWNPDPSKNEVWDKEDMKLNKLKEGRKWMPVWGGHAERYRTVMTKSNYYGIPVDDAELLVGFGDEPPQEFANIPFFVGTAHAGYHVFPGYEGRVIEAHSMRKISGMDNFEVSDFNPLGNNGGPRWTRSEKYRSGVIAVPPLAE